MCRFKHVLVPQYGAACAEARPLAASQAPVLANRADGPPLHVSIALPSRPGHCELRLHEPHDR